VQTGPVEDVAVLVQLGFEKACGEDADHQQDERGPGEECVTAGSVGELADKAVAFHVELVFGLPHAEEHDEGTERSKRREDVC
jgi:hypothetical protein